MTREGHVARLVIDRPEAKNALSQAMWQALPRLCANASDARVVLMEGAHGVFSAGADIKEFDRVYCTAASAQAANAAVRAGQQALADVPCPVIAVIDGACVGGGCGLALHADIRLASERAGFAVTPARLGIAYSRADTARLVAAVGLSAAKDMLFSARTVDAEEALKIGLVDKVVHSDRLADEARAQATAICALSPVALRAIKRAANAAAFGTDDAASIDAKIAESFGCADFKEGTRAFREKRRPVF